MPTKPPLPAVPSIYSVPRLSIGIQLKMMVGPWQQLGKYLITQLNHCLQSGNHYHAHFKAASGDINIIPTPIL